MSIEDTEFSPIPIPFTKSDPIANAIGMFDDDKKGDANKKLQAQIDVLKKENAKLDEQIAKFQHEKQFDQALGAINQQLAQYGKGPVNAQNPFRSEMPKQTVSGSAVSAPTPQVASTTKPATTNVGGSSGGMAKIG